MIRRIETFMLRYHMIPKGGKVVAGFSGGADSLCLMEVLRELAPKMGFTIFAIHIHHGIRDKSADEDARFVREYCQKHQIPLRTERVSAIEEAKRRGVGLEEAGRLLRYEKFEEYRRSCGADVIAVAHHQNDQAETVLFQIARGSSITGAGGIRPVQQKVIRPLLCVSRENIQDFLNKRGLTWQEDETNRDNAYTRNTIRNRIMPVLEENVNTKAAVHIADFALEMQEIEQYLGSQEAAVFHRCCQRQEKGILILNTLFSEHPLLIRRVIYRVITGLFGKKKDITREHVAAVADLFFKQSGRQVSLPGNLTALRRYDGICIGTEERKEADARCINLLPPAQVSIDGMHISVLEKKGKPEKIEEKKYTKWLDYDNIKNSLVLRKRQPDDVIVIDDQGHHKKLNRFLIDRKVPENKRDTIWILADGSNVVWIPGDRIGADYKISESTERVIEIRIEGEHET